MRKARPGLYLEDDLRSVKAAGVPHVMRLLMSHYAETEKESLINNSLQLELDTVEQIICAKDALEGNNCTDGD